MSEVVAPRPQQSRGRDAPLEIVFFLDNLDVGGTELAALRIARYLNPRTTHLRVVALRVDGPLREEFARLGVEVVELPVRGLAKVGTARAAVTLGRRLRRWRTDVLHTFDPYTNILGVPVGRASGVPLVVASHRWWDGVHGKGLDAVNAATVRLAHRVVANSPRVGDLVVAKGLPSSRLDIVPNFVESEVLAPPDPAWIGRRRMELGVPTEATVLGTVASLSWLKGHRSVLGACARRGEELASVHLLFVGDGPERPALEEMARELGMDQRVHFAGRLPNVPNLHHLFDVSVLCSLTEAFPNSLLEAMAAGKPVVASRVGGIPDAVCEGETGFLVDPGDESTLAHRLQRLVSEPLLRSTMGEVGRRRVEEHFTPAASMEALARTYGRVSSRTGRGEGALVSRNPLARGWKDGLSAVGGSAASPPASPAGRRHALPPVGGVANG
ncbi:MAG: glycosyltransferase [Gemmatimonadetes bacterium]|nr:glycosyltransferase [Gemmatimonadota bacterium]